MPVLTSNETVQRLEKMGIHALRCRSFSKAETIFRDQLDILKDFPYTDEVTLAMALNNLALALEFQGKDRPADTARRASLQIAFATPTNLTHLKAPSSLVAR
jgi:hypothetical protein